MWTMATPAYVKGCRFLMSSALVLQKWPKAELLKDRFYSSAAKAAQSRILKDRFCNSTVKAA
jgi:hypothetical protein